MIRNPESFFMGYFVGVLITATAVSAALIYIHYLEKKIRRTVTEIIKEIEQKKGKK